MDLSPPPEPQSPRTQQDASVDRPGRRILGVVLLAVVLFYVFEAFLVAASPPALVLLLPLVALVALAIAGWGLHLRYAGDWVLAALLTFVIVVVVSVVGGTLLSAWIETEFSRH